MLIHYIYLNAHQQTWAQVCGLFLSALVTPSPWCRSDGPLKLKEPIPNQTVPRFIPTWRRWLFWQNRLRGADARRACFWRTEVAPDLHADASFQHVYKVVITRKVPASNTSTVGPFEGPSFNPQPGQIKHTWASESFWWHFKPTPTFTVRGRRSCGCQVSLRRLHVSDLKAKRHTSTCGHATRRQQRSRTLIIPPRNRSHRGFTRRSRATLIHKYELTLIFNIVNLPKGSLTIEELGDHCKDFKNHRGTHR